MVAVSLAADKKQRLFNHWQFIDWSFGVENIKWLQFELALLQIRFLAVTLHSFQLETRSSKSNSEFFKP